jgi:membrane protein required for colicin V production
MVIDLVVAAIVIISAIISFLRGLIREVLTIAGVVGGLLAAFYLGPKLSPTFRGWFDIPEDPEKVEKLFDIIPMTMVADGLAYAAIFIAVVIIISVISHFTAGAIKAMGLGPVDRTLGVLFGIARAILLLGLLYLPFHLLMDQDSKTQYFSDSKTHYIIEKTATMMAKFLPSSDDVKKKVDEVSEGEIKKRLFENEILDDGKPKQKPSNTNKPETGYETDERQELEELIEENPSSNKDNNSLEDIIRQQTESNQTDYNRLMN